jgi:hypothetical protein
MKLILRAVAKSRSPKQKLLPPLKIKINRIFTKACPEKRSGYREHRRKENEFLYLDGLSPAGEGPFE